MEVPSDLLKIFRKAHMQKDDLVKGANENINWL